MKEHTTVLTPEKLIKRNWCREFLESVETSLSAIAWKFFKEKGRGYIYFTLDINVEHEKGNIFTVQLGELPTEIIYFAKGSEIFNCTRQLEKNAGQDKEWDSFYQLVDNYEVRNEYLIVIGCRSTKSEMVETWFLRKPEIAPYLARIR